MTRREYSFKAERNKSIWQDRTNGMKYREIAEKYAITQCRARQVFESYDRHYNKEQWKIRNGFV